MANSTAQNMTTTLQQNNASTAAVGALPNDPMAPGGGILAKAMNQTTGGATPASPMGASSPGVATSGTSTAIAPAPDYDSLINSMYQKDLNRQGDADGMAFYKHQMRDNGMTMDQLNTEFLNSPEYKAMHQPPTGTAPVLTPSPTIAPVTPLNVAPNQTVQGQLVGLTDPNNPLYQQWSTQGKEAAAANGFLNGSIQQTGILDSVMRNATPIATADANTYDRAAATNAGTANQFARDQLSADVSRYNTNAGSNTQLTTTGMNNQTALAQSQLSSDTQRFVASQGSDTQRAVASMNNASQLAVSQAHDANSVLIQSNQQASTAYNSYVAAVAQIDQNQYMDETAKRAAIVTQTQIFNAAMAALKTSNPGSSDVSSPIDTTTPAYTPPPVIPDVSGMLNFGGG